MQSKKFFRICPGIKSMFSTAAIILSKRRNRLVDDIFEKVLLLKLNHVFWEIG